MHPFERAAHEYVLGRLGRRELIDAAKDYVGTDRDTPSVHLLAGLTQHDEDEAHELFGRALGELGLSWPSDRDALRTDACRLAEALLAGRIDALTFCETVVQTAVAFDDFSACEGNDLTYASSLLPEVEGEDRARIEAVVREAARALLERFARS